MTLRKFIAEICMTEGWEAKAMEIMPDHVHLFVSAPPTISPTEIIARLKSITAIALFHEFPTLKKRAFWGSGLWSKGYYIGTAGDVSAKTILNYIENQKHI